MVVTKRALRVAVIGLGQHGTGIASLLKDNGHEFVGAVDVGDKVGEPLRKYVRNCDSVAVIRSSVEALIAQDKPQVAVLSAAISAQETAEQAATLMESGVSIVTLQPDMLVPESSWAERLDRIGKRTGASFLSTGVQDTWWIQLPSVIAGSTASLKSISITCHVNVADLPDFVGRAIGVGMSRDEFAGVAPMLEKGPAILGAPLLEAARAMGLTPLSTDVSVRAVIAEAPVRWSRGQMTVDSGRVLGMTHTTTFPTDEGVTFKGMLTTALVPTGERVADQMIVEGTPDLVLEIPRFPGAGVTNAAALNRIADVFSAPGGILSARELPPMRYRV